MRMKQLAGWPRHSSAGDNYCAARRQLLCGDWANKPPCPATAAPASLVNSNFSNPAVSNAAGTQKWTTDGDAFVGVQSGGVWSSTDATAPGGQAWTVSLISGIVTFTGKLNDLYVWPVRSGQ